MSGSSSEEGEPEKGGWKARCSKCKTGIVETYNSPGLLMQKTFRCESCLALRVEKLFKKKRGERVKAAVPA